MINGINSLPPEEFIVKFDLSSMQETFICHFNNLELMPNYDVYLNIEGFELYRMSIKCSSSSIGDTYIDYSNGYHLINQNVLYTISNTGSAELKFNFKVVNNVTDNVVLLKSYNIKLGALEGNNSVSNGTITDSNGNTNDMNFSNDVNFNENSAGIFNGINSNSSFSDIVYQVEDTFNSFKLFFSLFPSWVWITIVAGLGVVIVLRILGR